MREGDVALVPPRPGTETGDGGGDGGGDAAARPGSGTDQGSETVATGRVQAERFGRLDVVVNNAGYGFPGAVEETTDAEARQMSDVQIFGLWNVLRAVLPVLRTQRSGQILNISSMLGLVAVPGCDLYRAGKFAPEGLSEALTGEVAPFGVKVTVVEAGYFRTGFLTGDSPAPPVSTTEGYESVREMTRGHLELRGSRLGDPVRGAAVIISLAASKDAPLRRLPGSDARAYAEGGLEALRADLEAGREPAHGTDFPRP
ncbi:SDR family NAD(P)-dependent oxidoreductase [Streptosporangium sp. NPDC050855]|uniref:SDR family NAD(P)-dependent oxidoreductase n=1 Tax=Streptosporangium sp. NPDC050855 TaxID=3366194 RepID=UPI003790909A